VDAIAISTPPSPSSTLQMRTSSPTTLVALWQRYRWR
jgi:hypothetical protein